ncbi:MAG: bifunctional riboflavin kinase/FAD synthetase [Thermodesulfobacteriaceae bacterium]|nr:bifunctional riboflavin kinase/FAD synthetase [Thermodesulfobacteriaceae bacterium]MCX8041191.1 bifunctional riboflavin kinase/FAD synthetase [Thermodesulfobacteriaceae bacterium]MDW8135171.1 bifunctional riboflavin kinase/FAD synthetase [Thermodesulfobacterium sp.]
MKIYTPKDFPLKFDTVITLGSFDGVHLGHQTLLKETKNLAKKLEVKPLVVTFDPHPRQVLQPYSSFKLLTTLEEKLSLISEWGFEEVAIIPFTKSLAEWSPEFFVQEYIVDNLRAKGVVVGFNFRFGKQRKGDVELLTNLGEKYNFTVKVIEPIFVNGFRISSSLIRGLLEKGSIELANKLLGRPYFLTGKVIKGKGRGRILGYPTANLSISYSKLIPLSGVYAVWITLRGEKFKGAMNIGKNPTFDEKDLSIEVYIFDFNSEIYGEKIKVELINYVRGEKKFPSPEALKLQIEKDCQKIRQVLV